MTCLIALVKAVTTFVCVRGTIPIKKITGMLESRELCTNRPNVISFACMKKIKISKCCVILMRENQARDAFIGNVS